MNYNFVVYNKITFEQVGKLITSHSISLDDAIELLDTVRLEVVNSDDPDFMIDGKPCWYDDLEIALESEYTKAKYDALLDKCVVPNASGRKCFSLAVLDDDDIRWIVDNCPLDCLDVTDDGGNNLYEIAHEKGMILEDGDTIGNWMNTDIKIVVIKGNLYALNGSNGEKWLHCWKCTDRFTADPDGREYEIAPVYDWDRFNEEDGEFQDEDGAAISGIIGYEVL